MKPLISVIIPRYSENAKEIKLAIRRTTQFFQNRQIPIEILISHNGSRLHPHNFPNARSIVSQDVGLGEALKQGISSATGKYIYLISSDIPFNFSDAKNFLPILNKHDIIFLPNSTRCQYMALLGNVKFLPMDNTF